MPSVKLSTPVKCDLMQKFHDFLMRGPEYRTVIFTDNANISLWKVRSDVCLIYNGSILTDSNYVLSEVDNVEQMDEFCERLRDALEEYAIDWLFHVTKDEKSRQKVHVILTIDSPDLSEYLRAETTTGTGTGTAT